MAVRHFNRLIANPFILFAAISAAVSFACTSDTHAQSPSITADGSLGTKVTLEGSQYTIDNGTIRGSNQFHSFNRFNVASGETATFTYSGVESIANVISRVTGGNQSLINGTVGSDIPGANLFLINPSGVVFGAGSSLDVSGAFHVSTADYLRLADGGIFYANLSQGSDLTFQPPSAFGFLNDNPAGISIEKISGDLPDGDSLPSLQVADGQTFSAIGGDIDIVGSGTVDNEQATIAAPGGRINIASVASAGEVVLNAPDEQPDLRMDSFERLGTVDISNSAYIDARGNPGGRIIIRGGNFYFTESILTAATEGDADHSGVAVDINIADDMVMAAGELNDAEISSSALSSATGDAGDITIEAGRLQMTGAPESFQIADIASRVFFEGDGGDIFIKTGSLQLNQFSGILAQIFGSGQGGNITIETDTLQIDGGPSLAFISTSTFAPWYTETSGGAGDLTVTARDIIIQGGAGGFTGLASQVAGGTMGDPDGGKMIVDTDSLQLFDGGQLNAGIFSGAGEAGSIDVTANEILISGKNPGGFSAGIYTNVGNTYLSDGTVIPTFGNGGDILIHTGDLQMISDGQIGAYSENPGNSGNIVVKTGNLTVLDGSFLSSTNFGTGAAGDISVEADSVLLAGPNPEEGFTGMFALGGVFASGSGDIEVTADQLQIRDGAQISAKTSGPGAGGRIDVIAGQVDIRGFDPNSISSDGPNSGIFTSSTVFQEFVDQATGDAGDIHIQADTVNLSNRGTIGAFSTSQGDGGNIRIAAADAVHSHNGSISTASDHTEGGDIDIEAREIQLADQSAVSAKALGAGDAGNIVLSAGNTYQMTDSSVTTEAAVSDGGNIKINADQMVSLWNSEITASVGGGPDTVGGNIGIDPVYVTLSNSKVIANAFEGRGGNIRIVADIYLADPNSIVDASSEKGIDGEVDIRAPFKYLAEDLTPLPEDYGQAVVFLREPCIARIQGGKHSSLVVGQREVMPIEPGGLLPSPLAP